MNAFVWKSFKMRIHFSLKCDLNASMWHIYKMCTETGTSWLGGVYTVQCSTLALVQAGKCQLAGLTECVHSPVINIQMSTS